VTRERTGTSFLDLEAYIFDLDGVLTQTARLHAAAWKGMFDEFLRGRTAGTGGEAAPFDEGDDYQAYVDGKPRAEGVTGFLASRGIELPPGDPADAPGRETVAGLGQRKNELFHRLLQEQGVEVYPPAVKMVRELRQLGKKVALVTSSRNGPLIMAAAGLDGLFDAVIDGNAAAERGLKGKPSPDIFLEASRLLSVSPEVAAIVEDAVAGVEAGVAGGFGCVLGVDRGGNRVRLEQAGADVVVSDLSRVGRGLPDATGAVPCLLQEAGGRKLMVFLDYDGTLTPIVSRPELALLSPTVRETLARLAALTPVAVVSGRDVADVRALVGLDGLIYAGNHGLDIQGPRGVGMQSEEGTAALPLLAEVEEALWAKLEGVGGVLVERKRFSIAVHYRLVDDAHLPFVEQVVDSVLSVHRGLRDVPGKKVHDLRPDIAWDKGRAMAWLLRAQGASRHTVFPLYLGDDLTDEDAFRFVRGWGAGILVRDGDDRLTLATMTLAGTQEVEQFLVQLAAQLAEPAENAREAPEDRP